MTDEDHQTTIAASLMRDHSDDAVEALCWRHEACHAAAFIIPEDAVVNMLIGRSRKC